MCGRNRFYSVAALYHLQTTPLMRSFFYLLVGLTGLLWVLPGNVTAQQDAMFTKYMFNTLVYNPAYAGAYDYLSVTALHRGQWWGIEGAPSTQSLTIHSPVNDRVGLGFSLINDQIGPTGSTTANVVYAYRFPLGPGHLALSLQGGFVNWRADWSELTFEDPQSMDPAYNQANPSRWMPNFGAGVYYQSERFYAGFSSPHLVNYDLRDRTTGEADDVSIAKTYRHYYFFTGTAIPLNGEALVFRPSLLVKNVGLFGDAENVRGDISAPTEFDIDLSLFFQQRLWLGVSYRSAVEALTDGTSSVDSGDIWAALYLSNGLRIGAAYDYTLSDLQSLAGGSYELMLGYDFNFRVDRVVTPRYF